MKKKQCRIVVLATIILCLTVPESSGQLPASNLAKYWYYRNRLDYFVVPGEKLGESQIACTRNKLFEESSDMNLDYGQHGIYTGFYWSVLSTEYYLLKGYGQDDAANRTLQELYLALMAYVEHMDRCENYWGVAPSFDGFFIRENVPCNFLDPQTAEGRTSSGQRHLDLLNKRLTPDNHYLIPEVRFDGIPLGHPGYIDHRSCCSGTAGSTPMGPPDNVHPEPMSQDEAIGLMTGLALTIKLTDGTTCKPLAVEIADKIVRYLLNLDEINGTSDFRIYEPDGSMVEESRGGNTYYLAKGLIMAGESMTGETDYGGVNFIQNSVWSANSWWAWDCSLSKMAAMMAAIGDSWTWTDEGLMNITAHYNWDTFYILLWEVLHNKCMNQQEQQNLMIKTLDQLNNGPCEGTYSYASKYDHSGNETGVTEVHSGGGWGSTYKWCKEQIYQDGGDWWLANYNGLDFMILYNLFHIVKMGQPNIPPYINYKDLMLSGTLPLCLNSPSGAQTFIGTDDAPLTLIGFNSVTSNQVIDLETHPILHPQAGHVTYKSENSIRLLPGFHAKNGCSFLARLEDIDCESGQYRQPADYPDHVIDTVYDYYRIQASPSYLLEKNPGNFQDEITLLPNQNNFAPTWWCYPNPCTDELRISFSGNLNGDREFILLNNLGAEVQRFHFGELSFGNPTYVLNLQNIPCGTYWIRTFVDGQFSQQAITKY